MKSTQRLSLLMLNFKKSSTFFFTGGLNFLPTASEKDAVDSLTLDRLQNCG